MDRLVPAERRTTMSAEAAVKYVTETTEAEKERVAAWINTEEYKDLNFKREALVIAPPHACQPLGAELVAHAFEGLTPLCPWFPGVRLLLPLHP